MHSPGQEEGDKEVDCDRAASKGLVQGTGTTIDAAATFLDEVMGNSPINVSGATASGWSWSDEDSGLASCNTIGGLENHLMPQRSHNHGGHHDDDFSKSGVVSPGMYHYSPGVSLELAAWEATDQ